ncbi:hypothetical protein JOD57_003652 [Geodermatophilus bullaregiensis]|uniref:hypothetical protein n=1 Tax=Geodermatophilus bullaregiensis TaxID=1564160 RepID=UPI001958DA09|nr:hypothetical protein [Geodermatophilus bullaregiensis]MBM7807815.1 hypothetical protein [Geodermatophilus bullaregiensis]
MDVDDLERQHTLGSAVRRYEELRARDSLADPDDPGGPRPLSREEALELLALGEVIARRAAQGRQLTVRTARTTGASWAQIGRALGATRQSAWEAHRRWVDAQVARRGESGHMGFDDDEAAEARALLANDAD